MARDIGKGLAEHGLSHSWSTEQIGSAIAVTCILTHEQGHSERTTLSGEADTSGNKNAIQAIGSAVTYFERYTLMSITGLAALDSDDDGQGRWPSVNRTRARVKSSNIRPKPQGRAALA